MDDLETNWPGLALGVPVAELLAAVPHFQIRCSIVVSISACHAEDPGSVPGGGVLLKNCRPANQK